MFPFDILQYIVVDILQYIGYIGRAALTIYCAAADNISAWNNNFPQKRRNSEYVYSDDAQGEIEENLNGW